jgi:hypothetical protein
MNHFQLKEEDKMSLRPRGNLLWKKHVELYTDIFRQALIALSMLPKHGKKEPSISRQLNDLVRMECFKRGKEISYPICEVPIIQEIEDGDIDELKKSGRPDFTCRLKNQAAASYRKSELDFHIECKCLGHPKRNNWVFNKNYVNHGILRFDQEDKIYGKNVSHGMMIGYILSMNPDEICTEVCEELKRVRPNFPPVSISVTTRPLSEAVQTLCREVIKPEEFTIFHLWVKIY